MDSILVKFKPDVDQLLAQSVLDASGSTIVSKFKLLKNTFQVSIPDDADAGAIISAVEDSQYVIYAERNLSAKLDYTPNDEFLNNGTKAWHHNTINSFDAWDTKRFADDILVGVMDTGCRLTHEDLVGNLYTDPDTGEIGYNAADEDYDVTDYIGHGTSVAGMIGAIANNTDGGCGVCHLVKIVPLKVFYGDTYESDIAAMVRALEYAIEKKLNVLNISMGIQSYYTEYPVAALEEAMDVAEREGLIVCTSAGNNGLDLDIDPGQSEWPQGFTHSNQITVMASDYHNEVPAFSNYGKYNADIAAPAENDKNLMYLAPSWESDSDYSWFGYTSGASPIVAGAAALLLAVLSKTSKGVNPHPSTAALVKEVLLDTVQQLPAFTDKCVSGGILDLNSAVNSMSTLVGEALPIAAAEKGKLVKINRISRDDSDRLFDVEIEIIWSDAQCSVNPVSGMYKNEVTVKQCLSARSLPDESETDPVIDVPDSYTNTTDTEKIPSVGALWHQTGTDKYYECINEDISARLFSDAAFYTEITSFNNRSDYTDTTANAVPGLVGDKWHQTDENLFYLCIQDTAGGGVASEPLTDTNYYTDVTNDINDQYDYTNTLNDAEITVVNDRWHDTVNDKYYVCISSDASRLFTDTGYWVASTLGMWAISTQLVGPSGSGVPRINDDGTYDYTIIYTRSIVANDDFNFFGADFDTERKQTRQNVSFQRIRSKIGGDLEYQKNDDGNESGVSWNSNLNWQPNTAYAVGYVVHISGKLYRCTSAHTSSGTIDKNTLGFTKFTETTTEPPTYWVDSGLQARYGEWKNSYVRTGMFKLADGSSPGQYTLGKSATGQPVDIVFSNGVATDKGVGSVMMSLLDGGTFYCHTATNSTDYSDPAYYWEIVSRGDTGVSSQASSFIPGYIGLLVFSTTYQRWYRCVSVGSGFIAFTNATYWIPVICFDDYDKTISSGALNGIGLHPEELAPSFASNISRGGEGAGPTWGMISDPDYFIPLLQEQNVDLPWDYDYDWKPYTYFAANTVVWFDEKLYKFNSNTTTGPLFTSSGMTDVTANGVGPSAWDNSDMIDKHGPWNRFCTKRYIESGSVPYSSRFLIDYAPFPGTFVPSAVNDVVYVVATFKTYKAVQASSSAQLYTNTAYWVEISAHQAGNAIEELVPGAAAVFATGGDGLWPQPVATGVPLIDGSGGYALSTSARVNFSTNAELNPRMCEIYDAICREVGTISRFTYFPFDPSFLPEDLRRVPTEWADSSELQATVNESNTNEDSNAIIPIPVTAYNFEIVHEKPTALSMGFYAIEQRVTIRGDWVPDDDALDAIVAMFPNGQANKKHSKAICFIDLTGIAIKPWTGEYLDLA